MKNRKEMIIADVKKRLVHCFRFENVFAVEEASHARNPHAPYMWEADAFQLDGSMIHFGFVRWNFGEYVADNGEREDASDYPWDESPRFVSEETYFWDTDIDEIEKLTDKF